MVEAWQFLRVGNSANFGCDNCKHRHKTVISCEGGNLTPEWRLCHSCFYRPGSIYSPNIFNFTDSFPAEEIEEHDLPNLGAVMSWNKFFLPEGCWPCKYCTNAINDSGLTCSEHELMEEVS